MDRCYACQSSECDRSDCPCICHELVADFDDDELGLDPEEPYDA